MRQSWLDAGLPIRSVPCILPAMNNDVVLVTVKGVMPTPNGCAVFLGHDDKTIVIYVDHSVGNAIQMTLAGVKKERPLTHDLIGHILLGLGARLDHIVINDVTNGTFFARILLRMDNELGTKVVEIDARPSDSTVLALQQQRPIYVARKVLDSVEDMTEILERVLKQQADEAAKPKPEPGEDSPPEEDEEDPK
jgi:bifunctional DNase/RNase